MVRTTAIDWKEGGRDLVLIVAIWSASILIVNPIGDFPLVDDWVFGRTVQRLLETGRYEPLDFASMTLFTNVLWGALFCLPTGFSFTTLRFSTLVAGLIGLIGMYVLLRDLQQPRRIALLGALLLGFSPIYYVLSHGFMTDVLFTALSIWASIFFIRTLQTGSTWQLVAGAVLALAATLSRQLALCIPLAFAVTALMQSQATFKSFLRALTPTFVCLAAYLYFYSTGMMGFNYEAQAIRSLPDIQRFVGTVVNNLFYILVYLGLFLLPILLIATWNLWRSHANLVISIGMVAALIMILIVAAHARYADQVLLPMTGGWIGKSGVGMFTTRDVNFLQLNKMPPLPTVFWMTVTALGLFGAVLLMTALSLQAWKQISIHRFRTPLTNDDIAGRFTLLSSAIYFLVVLPVPSFFDKYVVPMIPFLTVAVVSVAGQLTCFSASARQVPRFIICTLLVAYSMFSIASTRDYLTWNRVRWMATRELMHESHVDAKDIDGGYEFFGLYIYNSLKDVSTGTEFDWWLLLRQRTYQIACGPVPGYSVRKQYSYQHWLPWHVQWIVVLRKEESSLAIPLPHRTDLK